MQTLAELITYLQENGRLKSPRILDAFQAIDRIRFLIPEVQHIAYGDFPLRIGHEQTISQPSTVAIMLEELQAEPGNRILDIGSGSGWTTALLAHMVGLNGKVYGTEIIPDLVRLGQSNLSQFQFPWARIDMASQQLGRPHEVFDKILVSAAAHHLPLALLSQLKPNGRLVIPVNTAIMIVDKDENGDLKTKQIEGFRFVPLIL